MKYIVSLRRSGFVASEFENQEAANGAEAGATNAGKFSKSSSCRRNPGPHLSVVDDLSETGLLVTAGLNLEIGEEIGLEFEEFGPIQGDGHAFAPNLDRSEFCSGRPIYAELSGVARKSLERKRRSLSLRADWALH